MTRTTRLLLLLPLVATACADEGKLQPTRDLTGDANPAGPTHTASVLAELGDAPLSPEEATELANELVAANPGLTEGIDSLTVTDAEVDSRGLGHVRYQQLHEGVPVFGAEAFVHTDASGLLFRLTETLHRHLSVDVSPSISAEAAVEVVRSGLSRSSRDVEAPTTELVVLRHNGADHLAWKVSMYIDDPADKPSQPFAFVDAHTGENVLAWNNLKETALSDSEKVTYDLRNSTRTNRAVVGDSSDTELNTTHTAVGHTLSFFSTNFGRSSYDNRGTTVSSYGHYGRNTVNAFWDGRRLLLGDGDGYYSNYLGVLDVTAHEFGHALTDYEANLTYSYESGALNEASSDILAAAVEAWVDGSTGQDTWDVGEDCWLADRALRFMQSPSDDGSSYDHYSARYTGTQDNGGVHWNSGIANHFFYLLTEGGQHHNPAYRTGNTVVGLGIDDAYAIWYEALSNYMTSSTNFSGARTATESACAALGYSATTCESVSYAWYEVGVGSAPSGGGGSTTGGGSTGGGSGTDTGTTDTGGTGGTTGTGGTGGTDTGTPAGCPSGFTEITGTLAAGADDQYSYSTTTTGSHDFTLAGPSSANFDLYLYKKKGKSYRSVDSSTGSTSTETIAYAGDRGDYVVQVFSTSGSGDYSLCYSLPN
jgi:vibriolysin